MSRRYAKPRARGEPQPDRHVATRLFENELADVDRRAGAIGLSRSAFLRAVLLADADVCALLRATITDLETQVAHLGGQVASLRDQLAGAEDRRAREVAGLRGLLDRDTSYEADRRRLERSFFYG